MATVCIKRWRLPDIYRVAKYNTYLYSWGWWNNLPTDATFRAWSHEFQMRRYHRQDSLELNNDSFDFLQLAHKTSAVFLDPRLNGFCCRVGRLTVFLGPVVVAHVALRPAVATDRGDPIIQHVAKQRGRAVTVATAFGSHDFQLSARSSQRVL